MIRTEINSFLKEGNGAGARRAIRRILRDRPDDHWLMTKMAQAFVVDGQLLKALHWCRRGLQLEPRCPIVLWDYAGINFLMHRRSVAIRVLEALKRRSLRSLTTGPCGQSRSWARGLLADCRLMLSRLYAERGQNTTALRQVREYLRLRKLGWRSSYPIAEARRHLDSLASKRRDAEVS